ncbi:hypothetical protein Tco_1568504, partial [Tanacetum coccineum]
LAGKKSGTDFILDDVFDEKPLAMTIELSLAAATITIPKTSTSLKAAELNSVPVISATKILEMLTPPKTIEVKSEPRMVENVFKDDNVNNNGTNNATAHVVGEEDLPQLLDSKGGSHVINVLQLYVKDFTSSKDSFTSKTLISNTYFQDNDLDVEEDTRSSNEFLADLNVEFHDRALLTNKNRFYKR